MLNLSEKDAAVLSHILRYCNEIEEFLQRFDNSYEAFTTDPLFLNAVSMAELQIGELTGHLSDNFKDNNSEIPWKQIRGMRNLFAHNYFHMDMEEIWDTAVNDTPILKKFCQRQLEMYNKSTTSSQT